jgi:hypothetical protein
MPALPGAPSRGLPGAPPWRRPSHPARPNPASLRRRPRLRGRPPGGGSRPYPGPSSGTCDHRSSRRRVPTMHRGTRVSPTNGHLPRTPHRGLGRAPNRGDGEGHHDQQGPIGPRRTTPTADRRLRAPLAVPATQCGFPNHGIQREPRRRRYAASVDADYIRRVAAVSRDAGSPQPMEFALPTVNAIRQAKEESHGAPIETPPASTHPEQH